MKKFLRSICALLCMLMLAGCAGTDKYPWTLTKADTVTISYKTRLNKFFPCIRCITMKKYKHAFIPPI